MKNDLIGEINPAQQFLIGLFLVTVIIYWIFNLLKGNLVEYLSNNNPIERRVERDKIINFVHTNVWGRSPKDEDYLSEEDDLLLVEPDSPSSPSTISSASASARSSAAEDEPGPSKSLLKKVLQKAHRKRPKKKSKKEITVNESSDSDFEIIEEKSSPKASPKPSDDSPNNPKSDRSRESTPKSENVICISDSPLSSETDVSLKGLTHLNLTLALWRPSMCKLNLTFL